MLRSLNEIEMTARKAARGCGLPWGIADETSKAIRWLQVFGLDGIGGLVAALELHHQSRERQNSRDYAPQSLHGIWRARAGTLSPLLTGVSLCDCIGLLRQQPVETGNIAQPLLVAGFVGQGLFGHGLFEQGVPARNSQSIQLQWSGVTLELRRNRLAVRGNKHDLAIHRSPRLVCRCIPISNQSMANAAEQITPSIGAVATPDNLWKKLEHYAAATYVAATEASRLSGAGAGLEDND